MNVWWLPLGPDDSPDAPRHVLVSLLSLVTGIHASKIELSYGPYGKPYLEGSCLEFNLSRTAGLAAIAFSTAGPVGIDVELEKPSNAERPLHPRLFSDSERSYLVKHPEAFLTLWTAKEAISKCQGSGLLGGSRIELEELEASRPALGGSLHVHRLPAVEPYVATVAWNGSDATVWSGALQRDVTRY